MSELDGSTLESPIRPKRKVRSENSVEEDEADGEDVEEVFSLTTHSEKESLISEFRHRKGRRVIPFSSSSTGECFQKSQWDQMARLFFQFRAIYNNGNMPKIISIYQRWYKILPNTNLSF